MLRETVVLVVGSEILEGRRRDANLGFLAPRLARLGIAVRETRIVPDIPGVLPAALRELAAPDRLLITTGGLGPTRDDLTRSEVAEAFGKRLVESPEARRHLEAWCARTGRMFADAGLLQLEVPEGTQSLDNPRGTALGMWLELADGCVVVSLPGVPHEVEAIWDAGLEARLQSGRPKAAAVKFFTAGLGEGVQEERMRGMEWPEGVDFCSLPGAMGVEIQLECRLDDEAEAVRRVARAQELLLPKLEPFVIRPLGKNPAEALVEVLAEKGWHVSFAESCTAGLAAGTLASVAGASKVLEGSIVTYANRIKQEFVAVPAEVLKAHGAVSQETVEAMAKGGRKLFGAELGLAVSGVAGPDGGTPEKPVGTVWIAASLGERTVCEKLSLTGSRDDIRLRAAWRLLVAGLRLLQA